MEVLITLMIMIIIGSLFFAILPYLLPFFLILFLLSLYHNYKVRKQYRDYFEDQRTQNFYTQDHTQQRTRNTDLDVIDVEYSEETIDDEK